VAVVLVLFSVSCTETSAKFKTVGRLTASYPSLAVVRVCAESGFRAGTPIGSKQILTVVRIEDTAVDGVVVEGLPFFRGLCLRPHPFESIGASEEEARVAWHSGNAALRKNKLSDCVPPVGATVLIGGFTPGESESLPSTRWKQAPVIVEATVVRTDQARATRPSACCALIAAPKADYSGFVGGPVAVRDGDSAKLWGIVVGQAPPALFTELATSQKSILGVHIIQKASAEDAK